MKLVITSIILFFSFVLTVDSQCGFESAHKARIKNNPAYAKIVKKSAEIIQSKASVNSEELLIIPVVVHVLHLGEPIGTGSNITDAQIISSIDRLNEVYRGRHIANGVDLKIEFRLARQTLDCEPTNGINRINASHIQGYSERGLERDDVNAADESELSALSYWSADKYFNIWTVTEIDDNGGGAGVQGYAYFYTGGAYEGSFMIYKSFGYDPNSQHPEWDLSFGRDNSTPIHEFGHYLHLHHTFKGDDNGSTCPADITYGVDSDGCADTEPHIRNLGTCAVGTNNACTGATYNDNAAKNFMNYCNCPDRFTNDQKTIARNTLTTIAVSLTESEGAVEAPDNIISPQSINCLPVSQNQGLTNPNAGILNVKYASMNIASRTTDRDHGYIDFSSKCVTYAEVERDIIDTIFVQTYTEDAYVNIWIDIDNSGEFSNDELFYEGQAVNYMVEAEIEYPESTVLETPIRIRIINDLQAIDDPCYSPLDGQGEDYTVIVSGIEIPEIPIGFPKSFSPNNDGINDVFYLMGYQRASSIEMKIFDKFGTLVFENNELNKGWDGTYKGKKMNPDVFKYIL